MSFRLKVEMFKLALVEVVFGSSVCEGSFGWRGVLVAEEEGVHGGTGWEGAVGAVHDGRLGGDEGADLWGNSEPPLDEEFRREGVLTVINMRSTSSRFSWKADKGKLQC